MNDPFILLEIVLWTRKPLAHRVFFACVKAYRILVRENKSVQTRIEKALTCIIKKHVIYGTTYYLASCKACYINDNYVVTDEESHLANYFLCTNARISLQETNEEGFIYHGAPKYDIYAHKTVRNLVWINSNHNGQCLIRFQAPNHFFISVYRCDCEQTMQKEAKWVMDSIYNCKPVREIFEAHILLLNKV